MNAAGATATPDAGPAVAWRVLTDTRDQVGECPVWDELQRALWWVDIDGRLLRRLDWDSGRVDSWPQAERVGCIALSTRGTVVAAMESGVFELDPGAAPAQQARRLARATHPREGMRFNDGRCDPQGRFWISTMVMDMSLAAPEGAWHVFDEHGLGTARIQGLITPNGLAFSPDGRQAWMSDSHPSVQRIWRLARDPATGALGERMPWVDMKPLPGRPDGAAVDAEGHYWICANDAGMVHRFAPSGELVRSIALPVSKPSMCCFAGPALDTLVVASIRPAAGSALDWSDAPHGALLACEPGVRGLPEPRFSRFPPGA